MAPEHLVVVARCESAGYGNLPEPLPAPELPGKHTSTIAAAAVRELFRLWDLDAGRFDAPEWNPFGELFPAGAKVVLKPNWVLHHNQSGQGLDCLITHPSLIEAVAGYVMLNRPAQVVIGDAPIQGCDFDALRQAAGLDAMAERLSRTHGIPCRIADFRRTVLEGGRPGGSKREGIRDESDYCLFDLGRDSLLEQLAVSNGNGFRVTMYNPDLLSRTHGPGRHRYLIARELIEADAVINLPKLKSHKKSGITGALKNLVGINGNKEFLPHHRKGGAAEGGDCYEGRSWLKRRAEDLLDAANRRDGGALQAMLVRSAEVAASVSRRAGGDDNLEGAWYGNDTVWRMCLDLQRILRYGRTDATLAATPQRVVVSITDAIVGGEGEGPLANTPVPSGFITGSLSAAAAEWVHARLMGFDPEAVPLVREAFGSFTYPLVSFAPSQIAVRIGRESLPAGDVYPLEGRRFLAPEGWRGHCELKDEYSTTA